MLRNDSAPTIEISLRQPKVSTIFCQGVLHSFAQMGKYIGERVIVNFNGQTVECAGKNQLKPIDVLIEPYIGMEMRDVNLKPFSSWSSYLSPITWISYLSISVYFNAFHYKVTDVDQEKIKQFGSIKYHAPNTSEITLGQESDMESHLQKYKLWKQQAAPEDCLILYGVSKGAATTFNAFAKYKYPEVKLVILEGCYYSIEDLKQRWSAPTSKILSAGMSIFSKYRADGPSPAKSIADFPPGVPVVLVTSEKDELVHCASTEKLARELANRNQNEVFLLKLKKSGHPSYMFDDKNDREAYEGFIHAIYKRYGLPFNAAFAEKGEPLIEECLLRAEQMKLSA